jgi:hypothetical protein
MKTANGSIYRGIVWPGTTAFPVGVGGEPISYFRLSHDFLRRQYVLSRNTLIEQLLTPPLPRTGLTTRRKHTGTTNSVHSSMKVLESI